VKFAAEADRVVIVGNDALAAVPLSQDGVIIESGADLAGLPIGRVQLRRAARDAVNQPPTAAVVERLAITRSAALVGSAYAAHQLTRRYITERRQFGAPLSKIAAVSGALAEMSVAIRHAQSAIDRAASVCVAEERSPLTRLAAVSTARIVTARTATSVAATAHQLHGAIGVTREYRLHRHTTMLWAGRDADIAEHRWSSSLGAMTTLAVAIDSAASSGRQAESPGAATSPGTPSQ
jgi:acyl-CoA dehydrogenase